MAIWYRTGTITVTNGSAAVAGSGSSWVDAEINAGDALHAPDGRNYEIVSVGGAGALTLASSYLGATASGQAYAIQPTHAIARSWRESAQTLINAYADYQAGALSGLWDDGTPALPAVSFAADPNTGFYRAGTDQIGFATGGMRRILLSTAAMQVDVPITGTGVRGLGGLWCTVGGTANALTLTHGVGALVVGLKVRFRAPAANTGATTINLDGLGAVACRTVTGAALPSGYIRGGVSTEAEYDGAYWVLNRQVERGLNPNGNYVRLADGTQICTHTAAIATATAGSTSDFSFPAAFLGTPNFSSINIDFDIGGPDVGARAQLNELKSVTSRNGLWRCRFLGYTGGDVGSLNFHLFAIGRWF